MSNEENKTSYPYTSNHDNLGFSCPIINTDHSYNPFVYNLQNPNHKYDPSDHMLHGALDQYNNTLSNAFDFSCSSINNNTNTLDQVVIRACGTSTSATENPCSASFSSSEVGVEDDSSKIKEDLELKDCLGDDDEKSKKVNTKKIKVEKKQRESRFAFMTKSEVDNLEDGFRWRKYGQKAVKNSPFPRSYYRCTNQKCNVKKRIERSFEDPSTVITTYEGQHNHHNPVTLRGNYNAAALLTPSLFLEPPTSPIFPTHQDLSNTLQNHPNTSTYYAHDLMNPEQHEQQQPRVLLPDRYDLMQHDMVSSFLHKPHEP